jgi:hypothetical protein
MIRKQFLTLVGLALLAGCGGGSPGPATGRASVRIVWPEESRLVPRASQSLEVVVRDEDGVVVGSATLNRPSSSATLSPLPTGTLTASARAFPQAGAQGVVQAQASAPLVIQPGATTDLALTLASTITRVGVTPGSASVPAQTSQTFSATAYDGSGQVVLTAPGGFAWSVPSGAGFAQIDPATGALTGTAAGAARVRATESESGVVGEVNVSVLDVPVVSLTPASATVFLDATPVGFSASVSQGVGQGVTWSVSPSGGGGGTISATGSYSPPANPGTYAVVATSTVDSRWVGSATVTVPTPVVVFTQSVPSVGVGRTTTFATRVDNLTDQRVTWSVKEAGGGTITAGVYTAPAVRGTYTVVATSTRDSRYKAELPVRATAGTGVVVVQ